MTTGALAENHMMFLWQLVNLELWLRWLRDWTPVGPEYSSRGSAGHSQQES